jgi:hypothetical protein
VQGRWWPWEPTHCTTHALIPAAAAAAAATIHHRCGESREGRHSAAVRGVRAGDVATRQSWQCDKALLFPLFALIKCTMRLGLSPRSSRNQVQRDSDSSVPIFSVLGHSAADGFFYGTFIFSNLRASTPLLPKSDTLKFHFFI